MELLSYWKREAARERREFEKLNPKAAKHLGELDRLRPEPEEFKEEEEERMPWMPLSENVAEGQFQAMRSMMVGPAGANAEVASIPEHLREAIRWAESEKEKRGIH